ncbi:hypothetical protein [Alloactinosynnema sp. L-07]|nr:hypothetical protein [Alloactinosynnema sp. L-07]
MQRQHALDHTGGGGQSRDALPWHMIVWLNGSFGVGKTTTGVRFAGRCGSSVPGHP